MPELAPPPRTMPRRLPLAGTVNLRHVGGYRTATGERLADGCLWRGDALHALDDEGRRVLAALPLRTVVDLREDDERGQRPDRLDGVGARVVAVPLYDGGLTADLDWPAVRRGELQGLYERLVQRHGHRIAAAVAALAGDGALPALVHCTAGKDRTGLVIAVLLSALGVRDEDVRVDFALTERYLDDAFVADVRRTVAVTGVPGGADGAGPVSDRALRGADPAWVAAALAHVRAHHGDAATYLTDHGLAPAALPALRAALFTTEDLQHA